MAKDKAARLLAQEILNMSSIGYSYPDLDYAQVDEMLCYVDIQIPLQSILRSINAREWQVASEVDGDNKLEELQKRFKKLQNKDQVIRELALCYEYGYTMFGVRYDDNWNIIKLELIPRENYTYDTTTKKWKLTFKNVELTEQYEDYFVVSTYNESIKYPMGNTILTPIHQAWYDLVNIDKKLRGIVEKYGSIITFFGYDATWSLDDEGKENIRTQAKLVSEMSGKDVIAVPMTDLAPKLQDNIYHITLDELKTDIHTELMDRLQHKINLYYLGATGQMETGSNRAESEVHQSEKEIVVQDRVDFIAQELYKILVIDSRNWGYDPENYYWSANKERDLYAEAELDNKENDSRKKVAETVEILGRGGKSFDNETLAELLNVSVDSLIDIEVIEPTSMEFAEENDAEGKLKASRELKGALLEKSTIAEDEVTQDLSKQIQQQIEEMKSPGALLKDTPYFNLDMSEMSKALDVASLIGYYDATFIHDITQDYLELNPWKLTFEEAVNAYSEVEPLMIERLEEHLSKNLDDYTTYIKNNTDMEVSRRISKDLQKNIKEGKTFEKWKENVGDILQRTGTSAKGYYLKTVYRTNILTSYNAAHQQEQRNNKEMFPYLLYDGVDDSRQSEICKTLDGTVRRANDPFWNTYYPPNHYQCRSGVISMTSEQFKERYGKLSRITKDIKELDLGDFDKSPLTTNYESKLKSKSKSWKQEQLSLEEAIKEE